MCKHFHSCVLFCSTPVCLPIWHQTLYVFRIPNIFKHQHHRTTARQAAETANSSTFRLLFYVNNSQFNIRTVHSNWHFDFALVPSHSGPYPLYLLWPSYSSSHPSMQYNVFTSAQQRQKILVFIHRDYWCECSSQYCKRDLKKKQNKMMEWSIVFSFSLFDNITLGQKSVNWISCACFFSSSQQFQLELSSIKRGEPIAVFKSINSGQISFNVNRETGIISITHKFVFDFPRMPQRSQF